WTGLTAYGHSLCGTTHAQWTSLLDRLLGNSRSHVSGVNGHNTLEVYLTGGAYGSGRWALLDQDELCLVFNHDAVPRMMSIPELVAMDKAARWKILDHTNNIQRQRGWYMFGQKDFGPQGSYRDYDGYDRYSSSLPNSSYEGAPPLLQLRRGEKLRRYYAPGLGGSTYVLWGLNLSGKGPSHDRTYSTQPERVYQKPPVPVKVGGPYSGFCGNAVYTYTPAFGSGDYKEGVVDEDDKQVTFEFNTPYVIGTTPPNKEKWGCYDEGGKNGLVISAGTASDVTVQISIDLGASWSHPRKLGTRIDLTDSVKGTQSYFLKFNAGAPALAGKGIVMRTVCQLNAYLLPRIDGVTEVKYRASQQGMQVYGPEKNKMAAVLHSGVMGASGMVFKLQSPKGAIITKVHAAALVASGNPPHLHTYDIDAGKEDSSLNTVLLDKFKVTIGLGDDADDHWSYIGIDGEADVRDLETDTLFLRFTNSGNRRYEYPLAWITYELPSQDECKVTFNFDKDRTLSHTFAGTVDEQTWKIADPGTVKNNWVELECIGEIIDDDRDLMDDTWERVSLGSLERSGGGDKDGDGACDLHEYLAGTDPSRADSMPSPGQRPGGKGTPRTVTLDRQAIVLDGDIDAENADKDLFASGNLQLEGHGNAGVPNRVFVKFDLTSITDCTTVTKAVLKLGYKKGSYKEQNTPQKIAAGAASRDIEAGQHTWNAMKDIYALGSDVTEFKGAGTAKYDELTATKAVALWLEKKRPNNGFIVMFADEASRHMKRGWYATDQGGAVHPELQIDYLDGGGMSPNKAPRIQEPALVTLTGAAAAVAIKAEDPDGDTLAYAWDFALSDGAAWSDSDQPSVTIPVAEGKPQLAAVRVSDPYGGSDYLVISLEGGRVSAAPDTAALIGEAGGSDSAAETDFPPEPIEAAAPAASEKEKGCGAGGGSMLLIALAFSVLIRRGNN
ncbi:DNRLRE domain-containing protein, partial [Planctomycetota bacterium]